MKKFLDLWDYRVGVMGLGPQKQPCPPRGETLNQHHFIKVSSQHQPQNRVFVSVFLLKTSNIWIFPKIAFVSSSLRSPFHNISAPDTTNKNSVQRSRSKNSVVLLSFPSFLSYGRSDIHYVKILEKSGRPLNKKRLI